MNLPNMLEAKKRTSEKKEIIRENINEDKFGTGKTYFVKTYGCQMNEHDSEEIRGVLESLGYESIEVMEEADVVILNTCAIRENAHNKVFGMIGRLKNLKETKDVIVGISGCMPQEESVVNKIKEKYKHVDIVFGTHNINELPTLLKEAIDHQQINVYSYEGKVIEGLPIKRANKIKAWINVIYGCNKFCTYCIVPYTRGAERSRLKEDIIKEAKGLVNNGYKEITLLGQNVNAYGKDLYSDYSFSELLKAISDTGIARLRFVTSHPWDFTTDMIKVIKENDNIMPYIHLPLQSGSNNMLKLMNRRYTKEEYLELFSKIKKEIPNVSITTDIIVGFPGETEGDFQETLEVVNTCKYDGAFTFIFSPRVGTPAAKLEDNTTKEEKEERLKRLNKIVNKYYLEGNEKYLNKIVKVLIEGKSKKNNNVLMGYTDTMKLVNVKADSKYIGEIINVKITEAKSFSLNGEAV